MKLLQLGSVGPSVQFLQLALRRAGYSEIIPDGIFGPVTRSAVTDFQRKNALVPDGTAGQYTHSALMPYYLGYVKHRVRPGDSFFTLARQYGSSVSAIEIANPGADSKNLTPGSFLTVPLGFDVVPTGTDYSSFLISCCVRALTARYPFLKLSEIGRSVMGNALWCMSFGRGNNRVLYNASHHANEWITTALLLKYTEELCRAFSSDGTVFSQNAREIFDYCTLALIPAVDPDGIDLVTGELSGGDFFNYAYRLSLDYPQYPFPSGWKANIRGIDLNLQYPAGWEQARENKALLGITSPAPADYVGSAPLTAPESRAMYDFTLSFMPFLTLSCHTQGEVIYWKYLDYTPYNSRVIADVFSSASGYALEDTPFASGFAGYKDWFIETFDRPGYTIEAGRGTNPLPLSQFDKIYNDNLGILTLGTVVT